MLQHGCACLQFHSVCCRSIVSASFRWCTSSGWFRSVPTTSCHQADAFFPKFEALIGRARLIVVDASTQYTIAELKLVTQKLEPARIMVVVEQRSHLPADLANLVVLTRPDVAGADSEDFLNQVQNWLRGAAETQQPKLLEEPMRLLHSRGISCSCDRGHLTLGNQAPATP